MTFLKWVTRIMSVLAILCLAGVIITVSIQIGSRFLPYSYIWTEELTRYLFLYAICFGAPLALLRNDYIAVDMIVGRFKGKVRKIYDIVINFTILALSAVMVKESYTFVQLGKVQSSATMPFQMSVIHATILIMSLFLLLFSLVKIGWLFTNKKNPYEVDGGGEL
ncbi:TRAP transporter small permease [Bacillus sp. B15-48]|uniref:TRAP transporter small permease n=1 Tax=Bacillus sp. B15-48 TaxID=1548601 RepID=UPI00193F7A85|nr:TRAP transporter small permease [Bacillus sp. B15-48]MBM4761255.1 TRAP transporter small permease subunit [Bacillus sp. B15-48]